MKYKIGDVCSFQNGYAFKSKEFDEHGKYRIIKIKELKSGNIYFFNDSSRINCEDIKTFEKYIIKKGDVLFALTGDPVSKPNPLSWVGRVAKYDYEEPALLNQRVCKLIGSDLVNTKYLYYFFCVFENLFSLASRAKGSANQANISTKDIANIEIDLPDLIVQNTIVKILDGLTDKIALNQKINDNLEQQAQIIYDKTFSEVSTKTTELSNIIEVRDGTHDSPKMQDNGYCLITSKHLLPFGVNKASANHISKSDFEKINERSLVEKQDILMSMIGTIGLVSYIPYKTVDFAIKNVALFKTSQNPKLAYYFLCYLKSDKTMKHIETCLAGSTQKYISLGELRKMPIYAPSNNEIEGFNSLVNPMFEEIVSRTNENSLLAEIRELLLSKLMSGELDISDIEI